MISSIKKILKRITPKRFRTFITKRLQRSFDLYWTLRSGVEVTVATRADWTVYNDIFVNGEYDVPIIACLREKNPADALSILDLGANVGYFSLRFVDLMRQNGHENTHYHITMVEGSPTLAKEIKKRLAFTGNLSKNVRVVNGLVGKREGSGRIREEVAHSTNSTLQSSSKDTQVDYVDLTTLVQQLSPIDLLKCDIEGAELQFIENYPDLLKCVKSAVFEIHPQVCNFDRCIQLLESAGLKQSKILRQADGIMVIHAWR